MTHTFTATIPRTRTSVRRMKNGQLRVTIDTDYIDVFETSRLLAEIGKPLTITIERKE